MGSLIMIIYNDDHVYAVVVFLYNLLSEKILKLSQVLILYNSTFNRLLS